MYQVDYRNLLTPKRTQSDGSAGVCMMSTTWKEAQHLSFLNFIHSFLAASCFRLTVVPIAPDFIFNSGGLSVAFMFVTNWDCSDTSPVFSRVLKLKAQFAHFYVLATLPTKEQNESFVRSYFKYAMEFGKPVFVPVQDLEMGFMKIVNIAHALGGNSFLHKTPCHKGLFGIASIFKCPTFLQRVSIKTMVNTQQALIDENGLLTLVNVLYLVSKWQGGISRMEAERERSVQAMDEFLKVVTTIPGIDNHDANSLSQAIGSIEAIAKASKEFILDNTDLSADKAETITRFFRDPKFYGSPKIL